MPLLSIASQLLSYFPPSLFAICFYLVLIVWIRLLESNNIQPLAKTFRILVGFGLVSTVINLVNGIVWSLAPNPNNTSWTQWLKVITDFVTLSAQCAVGMLFAVYTIRFFIKRKDQDLGAETHRALTRLTILSVLGFATFLAAFIANLMVVQPAITTAVGGSLAIILVRNLNGTIRAAALLLIISIRGGSRGKSVGKHP